VSRRVQEMGIRMALGANARDVIRLILRDGIVQLGVGLTLGLGLAFGVANVVQLIAFDVQGRDPAVFGSIVVVIAIVGVLASLIPARRATRVDPMVALHLINFARTPVPRTAIRLRGYMAIAPITAGNE